MTTAHGPRTIAYLGNFGPPHSTENHVAQAFEFAGHEVLRLQENSPQSWQTVRHLSVDLVLWTRTWHFELPPDVAQIIATTSAPFVGFHLDKLWGLDRQRIIPPNVAQVHTGNEDPFFYVDKLITADGGHDEQWASAGIDHTWMPPATFAAAIGATPLVDPRRYPGVLAFVGSWSRYHPEWPWRQQMIAWARKRYGRDFVTMPQSGAPRIVGEALDSVYATIPMILGDSCLAGGGDRYWSDRIPETLGRGGFLIHPHVDGMAEHFTAGEHLVTFPIGDFDGLAATIDYYRDHAADRKAIAAAGRAHVLEHHTYERRAVQIIELLESEGYL